MIKKWTMILFKRRVLLALLILIQFAIIGLIVNQSIATSLVWETIFTLLSIGVALHVVWKKGKEAYKITWILQVLIFPIYGTLFYIIFNRQTQTKKLQRKLETIYALHRSYLLDDFTVLEEAKNAHPEQGRLMHYLTHTAGFPVYDQTDVTYYAIGETYFEAMLDEMRRAKRYIFFEFFIVADGTMWDQVLEVMERKAKEGVEVRVMYDDIGSFTKLDPNTKQRLIDKGIDCRIYNPFHPVLTSSQNNRDHRKVLSIDGVTAFTGGVNISDEYINEINRFGHWKDNGIKMSGKGAWGLTLIFLQLWQTMDDHLSDEAIRRLLPPVIENYLENSAAGYVQPFSDSPTDTENIGENVLIKLIYAAKESIDIYTPYLILDENLETALILAAESGVKIRIVTPKQWDKYLVHVTTRSYYNELVDAGVQIYEYTKGFMHAKTVLADGEVAVVGTINFDYRSLYLHFENGVLLYGNRVLKEIETDINETIKMSEEMTEEDLSYSLPVRLVKSLLRLFAPLM